MRKALLLLLPLAALALLTIVAARSCDAPPRTAATPPAERSGALPRERHRVADVEVRDAVDDPVAEEPVEEDAGTEPLEWLTSRDLRLDVPRRFLSGIVVHPDGEPVAGVGVELTSRWLPNVVARAAAIPPNFASGPTDFVPPPRIPQLRATVKTRADGRFRLPYVVGEHLWLTVVGDAWAGPVERPHEEQRIVIAPEQSGVRVHVTRASDGTPVEGALVIVRSGERFPIAIVETDEGGHVHVGTSCAGRKTVSVRAGGLARVEGLTMDAFPGETRDLEVALRPGRRVTGRVVDAETGRPIAGARVGYGVPRHWTTPPGTRTDADGRFAIDGMPSRANTSSPIGATADGYVPVARWLPSPERSPGDLETGLRMVRGGALRLRCVDGAGNPVADALVYAEHERTRDRGGDRSTEVVDIGEGAVWTGSDGVAVIPDLPGGEDPAEVRVYLRGVEVVRRAAPAPAPGETVDLGDVVVAAGRALRGTVRGPDGAPVPGIRVVVVPDDPANVHLYALGSAALGPSDERHGVTDEEGRFEIAGLAPGTWHALAWTEGGPHAPALARGVVVPPDGDPAPLGIRLPRAVVLHGVLRDADGRAMAGAEVGALRDAPVPFNLLERTRTDEQGRFRLPGVTAAGERVWIDVELPGACVGVLVTAGEAPLEIRLDRLTLYDPDEYDRAMGR